MNKKTCCTFLPFFGAFKIFLGYESCAKWIHIFWKFCYFFWCFVHTYEIFYFFWIFSLNCVSRIPSVRIALKKGRVQGKFTKKKGGRKKICIAQAVSAFFSMQKPINYNMTANMWYYKQWHMNTWTTIRKGAIFKIRSHVWSKFTMIGENQQTNFQMMTFTIQLQKSLNKINSNQEFPRAELMTDQL